MTILQEDTINSLTYPTLVSELIKPGNNFIEGMTPGSAALLHTSVGLMVSANDLEAYTLAGTKEARDTHLGQCEFYLEAMATELSFDYFVDTRIVSAPSAELVHEIRVAVSDILANTMDAVIHKKAIPTALFYDSMDLVRHLLDTYYNVNNISRDDVLSKNIETLSKKPYRRRGMRCTDGNENGEEA